MPRIYWAYFYDDFVNAKNRRRKNARRKGTAFLGQHQDRVCPVYDQARHNSFLSRNACLFFGFFPCIKSTRTNTAFLRFSKVWLVQTSLNRKRRRKPSNRTNICTGAKCRIKNVENSEISVLHKTRNPHNSWTLCIPDGSSVENEKRTSSFSIQSPLKQERNIFFIINQ